MRIYVLEFSEMIYIYIYVNVILLNFESKFLIFN